MGTVPDPMRSAKRALVATSQEENCLEKLESPKHQHKQASIERSSNGYSFSAKVQSVGKCSFDMNCEAETSMLSSGSISLSKEDCLTAVDPVKDSGCHVINQALNDSCILMNTAIKGSGTQEDCKIVARGSGGPLCSTVDDKALLSPGGGGGAVANKTHDNNSALLPTQQVFRQITKETVDSSSDCEKIQVPLATKELRYVSDCDSKDHVCLGSGLRDTTNPSSHPNARTKQEPLLKSGLESAPQPLSCSETAEEVSPEHFKFKDTGTMTMQFENRTADEETVRRTHQDAEVQAVASMESRSASTSPSILVSFLRENVPSEAKQSQEDLEIICRGVKGKELPEILDKLAVLGQVIPSGDIMPKVCIQAPTGMEKWIEAQPVKLSDELAGRQDAACLSLLNKSEHPCTVASGYTEEISIKGMELKADGTGSPGSIAQSLLDTSVLQNTRPVYQISANTSNQPVFPPANHETQLPPSSALSETSSKCQQHEPFVPENQLPSPSCHRVLESAKPIITHAIQSSQKNLPQIKILGDFEMGPTSFHVDVKPKKEESVIRLSPKEKKVDSRRAESQTLSITVTAQKDQEISPGDNQEVEGLDSQKLAAGKLASEMSSHSIPGLLSKISKVGKESKLALLVTPSPTQPMSSPCRNKKVIKPVPNTKVHLKQSKNVRDVVWDEQGMTWEVYGASLDPESLGVAIQNHLQRQIREHEKLIKAQSVQTRKSISSDTSSHKKLKGRQHNVFHNMLQNFRRPNCCVRPAASSVLD